MRIDHVVIVVPDLEAAADRLLEDHGLGSVPGGRHPGHGTANRIVPLGADYVELVAVVDEAEAAADAFGTLVGDHAAGGGGPFAWCIATDDVEAVAGRLGLVAGAWTRERPDGIVLRWQLAGLERSLADPSLPFFITWDIPPELHPGRAAADHRERTEGIARVDLRGDRDRVKAHLLGEDLPVRVAPGVGSVTAVVIATDRGEIVLG
jgi:hypothetical protein